jgi:hypothetical protein
MPMLYVLYSKNKVTNKHFNDQRSSDKKVRSLTSQRCWKPSPLIVNWLKRETFDVLTMTFSPMFIILKNVVW